jgi:hypothetical protein
MSEGNILPSGRQHVAGEPYEFTPEHPPLHYAGHGNLGGDVVPITRAVRHHFVAGESGSGKTKSVIFPVLRAALEYPKREDYDRYAKVVQSRGEVADAFEDLQPSLLVFDPKSELRRFVEEYGGQRKVYSIDFASPCFVFHAFEGRQLPVAPKEAWATIRNLSEYMAKDAANSKDPFWTQFASSIVLAMMEVDFALYQRGQEVLVEFWNGIRNVLIEKENMDPALVAPLAYSNLHYFKPHLTLIHLLACNWKCAVTWYSAYCTHYKVPLDASLQVGALVNLADGTSSSVTAVLNAMLLELASEELTRHVCLNPLESPSRADLDSANQLLLEVREVLDEGHVVVYRPRDTSPVSEIVGRAIKTKFYELSFVRNNPVRPFFVVADEFQRILHFGPREGEQSFLDRCRSFRVSVTLATQSMAALRYRVESMAGQQLGAAALESILLNCANWYVFRTNDPDLQRRFRQMIPPPPVSGYPHIMETYPLASLQTGEAYFQLGDGSWGRGRAELMRRAPTAADGGSLQEPEG